MRAGPAADARGRNPGHQRHAQRRGGPDPSRRPFLWRRDCVQDRDRFAVRASRAQPDADRAGAADAAVRQRCGPQAARALRAGRARGFRGHLEWIGARGDRQVHGVLERVRPAGSAAGERAPAHDRARRTSLPSISRRRSPRKMSRPRRPRFAFRRCCFRAGCRPISPSASCSGSARSSTAPRSGICRPPAICCRSPMRRRSIPRSRGISPARTNSPAVPLAVEAALAEAVSGARGVTSE